MLVSTSQQLGLCLAFLLSRNIVVGNPLLRRDGPPVAIQSRRQLYNCDAAPWMKAIEAQAWADAGALADEAVNWRAGRKYQAAMDLYMGWNSVDSKYKGTITGKFSLSIKVKKD